ncbi:peptidyl-prolyl cis-trans isomerase CYP21-4-like protein isoform X1 [Cinnamomum micranthum f. kanehirae]|uniref:Peptidyl-prolyl cis-trans isomerase n=1 Tax=Cinnamomum micranthum f. kanehirae TaxID=337451 RepID=A0A3S3NUS6_9MAGN|nr:peptidyl-prolyl cis-trans isomerase CYP21-4-like protein isoform X1 [Cinnamomum micranthum f. kanehirae]
MARIKPQALLLQSKRKKGPTRINVTTIIICNLVVVLIVFSLVASYRHLYRRSGSQDGISLQNFENIQVLGELKKYDLPSYAIINTSKGSVTVELNKDASPEIVDKFLDLCQKGDFKGMLFHHVIKNYVIQGGDLQGLGAADDWILKGKPHGQVAISPKHEAFMLGTSKAKQDSKRFDLFITTAPIPDLNDKITVFGRVIKGEDVVQEIEEVDTDEHFRPKSPIGILSITLKQEP